MYLVPILRMTTEEKILSDSKMLFMRYGIKSITMDDIAKHMGMSKKTIYQYVSNKEELLNKILTDHTAAETDAIHQIHQMAKDAIDEMIMIAKYVIKQLKGLSPNTIYDLQKYYQKSFKVWEAFHHEVVFNIVKSNIERGMSEGLYRSDLNARFISKVYIETTKLLTDEVTFPLFDKHFDDLYKQFIKYHIRGIVSDKGYKKLNNYLNKGIQ